MVICVFDMHYDLLSVAYVCYLKNDYSYLEQWCKFYNDDNVKGVIANLYFMSKDEMKEELHPDYYRDDVPVVSMFQISTDIVKRFLPQTDLLFSIEGCDYLDVSDLDILYSLGLRSILPVWNNKNKYASGNRGNDGLTDEGRKLIDKAIQLGILIDLSHTNEQSFYDITNYIKQKQQQGFKTYVMASHSNSISLCHRKRNLTDNQIKVIGQLGGMIGVFSNRNFVVPYEIKDIATLDEKRKIYLQHIKHIISIIGVKHVGVATDDMNFCGSMYKDTAIYEYSTIASSLKQDLEKHFNSLDVFMIMYGNMKDRYNQLKDQINKI